ncbi:RNA-guided endonuclease IscB [Streptomyces sp. TR02-1]|uniref:RNA-guided endonuclease IscB n=1 Tax=Streptomyces sp. TR02-1 TaxID=3385977 RepID=UPI0039A28986
MDGEQGREAHPSVLVLDKHKRPLQPCSPARARKLLSKGRAVVHRHAPFVIRLRDRTTDESTVSGVEVAIDPGAERTGIALFTAPAPEERRGLLAIELTHRGGQIRDRMTQRSAYRRGRRTRNLRYRAPRYSNRSRREGWLSPSHRHRVDTTVSWAKRLRRWAPVRALHVERVAFDLHALAADRPLQGVEYQRGTLAGTEVREYLLAKWDRCCAYCQASGVPLNIDHVHPVSRGGTNRVSNLVVSCVPCNQAKTNRPVTEFLSRKPKRLRAVLAQAKAPLRDAAAVNKTRRALWRSLTSTGLPVHVASGGRTKWNRQRNSLPKTHTLDALCVGRLDRVTQHPNAVWEVRATCRGTYQRTTPDRHGFPRLIRPRTKQQHGFFTGDLARATVPRGKWKGTWAGRIMVRSNGRHSMPTSLGRLDVLARHLRLIQRADGYGYNTRREGRPEDG